MKVAVLGAGAIVAPAIVRDLAESAEVDALHLLDTDRTRAQATADAHGRGKAQAGAVDARDPQSLALALDGFGLLVNASPCRLNLAAMDGALLAGCGYLDLGGLFHMTRRQLARSDEFAERGLLAVLGCGAGPGKTNVMAARAAAELDAVEVIRTATAGMDETSTGPAGTPAAPVVVRDGVEVELAPLTAGGTIAFPDPFGECASVFALHSEPLTLPPSLGARDCDSRLALDPSPRTWSAQRVDVTGTKHGAPRTVTVTALTPPHERWGLGGGIVSTGSVAAAAVRLYARGALPLAGVLAPETALEPAALFAELESRGTIFEISTTSEVNA